MLSRDKKILYVSESYLGHDKNGFIEAVSTETLTTINRIMVGSSPMDIVEGERNIYVSNFTDGTISVINKSNMIVQDEIYIGGMPKGMIIYKDRLFVADYLKGRLYIIENHQINKVIAIESEPNAMTLF